MKPYEIFILVGIMWNFFGLVIIGGLSGNRASPICYCDGCEFMHYWWLYNAYEFNHFGTTVLFLWFNLLCPIATICHWIYYGLHKLFTIGRR